jgi:hypothetical protein
MVLTCVGSEKNVLFTNSNYIVALACASCCYNLILATFINVEECHVQLSHDAKTSLCGGIVAALMEFSTDHKGGISIHMTTTKKHQTPHTNHID